MPPLRRPRLDPVRRELPPPPPRAARSSSERPFPPARLIPLNGRGPEDVVADSQGRLLCGLADGRIVRVEPDSGSIETIAETGGRPLGLEMLGDGRVVGCDAKRGLLRVDPSSGAGAAPRSGGGNTPPPVLSHPNPPRARTAPSFHPPPPPRL